MNVLPSELGENIFLVFIVGPVMHGVVGLERDNLSIGMQQVEKFLAENGEPGRLPQDVALTSMYQTLVTNPGNEGAMAHAAIVATWLVLNHPTQDQPVNPANLKWVTFAAKEDEYTYQGGSDDASFEASRVSMMSDVSGVVPTRH
ncbi:MAG: hypothetical protein EOP83_22105 [Verrucomicrobiaceae bacterium]|nr:MAG: hypothetical protein EOP83_22105 [Verrucomicrobiaceae bacterium]